MSAVSRHTGIARARGFTLIEMMTVVVVMTIMLSFAVPGLTHLLESQRLRSFAFDLVSDLTLARNESLKRGAAVTVAPIAGADWSSGWRVRVTASGEVLRQRSQAGGTTAVSGAPASVAYDRNGRLTGSASVVRVELDSVSLTDDSQARCVSIDLLGRARSDVGKCS